MLNRFLMKNCIPLVSDLFGCKACKAVLCNDLSRLRKRQCADGTADLLGNQLNDQCVTGCILNDRGGIIPLLRTEPVADVPLKKEQRSFFGNGFHFKGVIPLRKRLVSGQKQQTPARLQELRDTDAVVAGVIVHNQYAIFTVAKFPENPQFSLKVGFFCF